ncbi:MAG: DUF2934 domain-containing protein [Nitrospira sp.]|nr:DUF2934 domain-containing protein [Nitrospira sp.]
MKSVTISTTKQERKAPVPQQQQPSKKTATQKFHVLPQAPCGDLNILIAKRAYELYSERGYRHGNAMEDWLDAEREILSQIPPV